jgi:CheY-like chemotaxis protein
MARKLMVVDRYHTIDEGIRSAFPSETLEVASYEDGLTALDMLSTVDPDLIIADYEMQGINISRFCEKLQKRSATKTRPLILLADPAEPLDQERLRTAGVSEFIKKPVEMEGLVEKIKEYLPPSPAQNTIETESLTQDQTDSLKIEELLGWSVTGEKTVIGQPPPGQTPQASVQDDDRTVIEHMPVFGEKFVGGTESSSPESASPELAIEPQKAEPLAEAHQITSAEVINDLGEAASTSQPHIVSQEAVIEKEPTGTAPAPEDLSTQGVEPSASTLSQEVAEDSVSKVAREIIEKVAWEVVPTIAEALIKEELEKLKSGQPK